MIGLSSRSRTSTRLVLVSVVVVVSAVGLAGCSGGATASQPGASGTTASSSQSASVSGPTSTPLETKPSAGQCWNATGEQIGNQSTWNGTPAVPCSGPHNAETTYVGDIPDSATSPYSGVPDAYTALVTTACNDTQLSVTFGANVTGLQDTWWANGSADHYPASRSAAPVLVGYSYYFPTAAAWSTGQRWFRCDVGGPTTYDAPNWNTAKSSFKSVYATNPRFFQICTDSKFATGAAVSATPTSAFGTYKSCTTSTPWKLVSVVVLAKNKTEPFPGTSHVVDRATTLCPPSDKKRHFEVPSQSIWSSNGLTGASCWVDDPSQ